MPISRGRVELAASKGNREGLVALRTTLARAIDAGPGARDLASLVKQLTDVLRELAALDPPRAEVSPLDELAAARAARLANAAGQ